jgi:hypothetical protein
MQSPQMASHMFLLRLELQQVHLIQGSVVKGEFLFPIHRYLEQLVWLEQLYFVLLIEKVKIELDIRERFEHEGHSLIKLQVVHHPIHLEQSVQVLIHIEGLWPLAQLMTQLIDVEEG